jgi:hypothetical protein
MAESITEMIIPGTYIDVRAEGLIGVGGIATGNVGIVGTAAKGEVNEVKILSSFAEARDVFGEYDAWVNGSSDELTLVRALQQVFANGASTVYAVRSAATGYAAASRALTDTTGTVVTITAGSPGSWGHDVKVQIKAASQNGFVEKRSQSVTSDPLQPLHANIAESPRNVIKITKGDTGQTFRLKLATTGTAARGKVRVAMDGGLTFHADDDPEEGDTLTASYEVAQSSCRDIVITYRNVKEVYTVVDATDIKRDIDKSSVLVTVTIESGAGPRLPDVMTDALPLEGGSNGESAGSSEYTTSLAKLEAEPVNIVLLAGLGFSDASAALAAHAETTENEGRERLTLVGADEDTSSAVAANADEIGDDRVILTAPGIKAVDLIGGGMVNLPPAYSASAVAGLIASLAVQSSPTNKVLRIPGLTTDYSDGKIKNLLNNRVLVLEKKAGYRVVKGITTDTGPFKQISVRRIVDYAKEGVRRATLPYIGRLNNARVRGAMQGTLNGFLSQMLLDEQLTDFQLEVTATREQEINGIAVVTLYLKPTFCIDYIKVIMNLS